MAALRMSRHDSFEDREKLSHKRGCDPLDAREIDHRWGMGENLCRLHGRDHCPKRALQKSGRLAAYQDPIVQYVVDSKC